MLSPASVHDALTMTLNGARGPTADEMRESLGTRLSRARSRRPGLGGSDRLPPSQEGRRDQGRQLALAEGRRLVLARFLATNRDYFAADAKPLPSDLSAAVAAINQWVEQRTGGRITQLLSSLIPQMGRARQHALREGRLVGRALRRGGHPPEPFTLPDASKVDVPMMHGSSTSRSSPRPSTTPCRYRPTGWWT